jgi:exopolysaccharide biosynthesis WecB/TagA/CpsF family protein
MSKVYFSNLPPEDYLTKERFIFNFFNLHDIWWVYNNQDYGVFASNKKNKVFPDGKFISNWLRINQQRGPEFTSRFLNSPLSKKKRHLFIGLEEEEMIKISNICGIKKTNLSCYNPPYIKGTEFSRKEINKILSIIKYKKPDYCWVCIGAPKQTFLANRLFNKTKSCSFFCVGAATDFLLGKKSEAPKIFRKLGIEWLYRLITDFKYSKKKVWRSFMGAWYVLRGKVKLGKGR